MEKPAKAPKPKERSKFRHPLLEGRERGIWYPELAGKLPGYPKTLEMFITVRERARRLINERRARGEVIGRAGVGNGLSKHDKVNRPRIERENAEAKAIVQLLREKGLLVEPENDMGNEALACGVEILRNKQAGSQMRLQAARMVLEWTKAKPATKVENTIRTAEAFLEDLVETEAYNQRAG